MSERVAELWLQQDRHAGDHERLFRTVADVVDARRVLYPGSWVDIAASLVWPEIVYVDLDARAAEFFSDRRGVADLLAELGGSASHGVWRFIHADYREDLGFEPESFDLLISMSAGLVSEACRPYLRIGGTLLVNPSHGDAEMARHDASLTLTGVVQRRAGAYVARTDVDGFMLPMDVASATAEHVRSSGRGVPYTRSAVAYLFTRAR